MDARVRPARQSDKKPLMSFIKDVWGGHDYIPYVWDWWMKDPNGKMFVVEVDGVPVGMNRVRFLEDGSAWFEGVRVHPDFRGRGLATMLGENSMKVAKEMGIGVFRLVSGSRNYLAHRQIARIRFEEISRFSVYEPPKGRRRGRKVARRAKSEDAPAVISLIERSKEYRTGGGFFFHGYTAASLNPEVIRKLVSEGAIWRFGEAVAVTREYGERWTWEEICFVGGPAEDALELIDSVLGWSRRAKVRWVFVPQGSPIIHGLRARGFRRNYSGVLFERLAAKG
ncbi:MAG: GNAT family N-acetyltransferase [Nitrososphaerota archaeon]|nr:GNAT family N-acetyltransferase [Nitrososphaerota archaeon]